MLSIARKFILKVQLLTERSSGSRFIFFSENGCPLQWRVSLFLDAFATSFALHVIVNFLDAN